MDEVTNPFESLHRTIVFDPRDWSADNRDAWLYGIVVGWDNNEESFEEFSEKFLWSRNTWDRLQLLHREYLKYKELSECN